MFKQEVDIEKWERKEAFNHYSGFSNPYFNLTAHLEIGPLMEKCKLNSQNLYFSYAYYSMKVFNEIEEFHYRIAPDAKVYKYDRIDFAPTILSAQKKLLFSHIDYQQDILVFIKNAQYETQKVLDSNVLDPGNRAHVVYATVIPWVSFTSIRHPVGPSVQSGIPLLAYGKIYEQSGKKYIPISLDAHHALVDGYHAGMFFEKLQNHFLCL